jgi:hypothetical protein
MNVHGPDDDAQGLPDLPIQLVDRQQDDGEPAMPSTIRWSHPHLAGAGRGVAVAQQGVESRP